jgi:membrane protein
MADRTDSTRDTRARTGAGATSADESSGQGRVAREGSSSGGGAPETPTDLDRDAGKGVLKRTWREFREDNLTDWAAALTYYGVLALFPGLLVLVSMLGLLGQNATQTLIDNIGGLAPGAAQDIATNAIENLQQNQGAAGIMGLVGIAAALWAASNYVGAFARASNAIYEIEEGRPFWKLKPIQLGITLVLVILLAITSMAVVISGPLAKTVGDVIGAGDTAVAIWDIAKWPVIAAIFMTMLAFLYYSAPNVKHPKFRWVSPGGIVAVVVWIIASVAFAFYVANFGNYNATYGALGGVIIFLTWMWITNIVVLLGAEINAEAERGRQIEGGMPEEREPFLEPRDTRKLKQR